MSKISLEEALLLELDKENKKSNKLQETTLKQIYDQLPGVDVHDEPIDTSNVDGLLDGVIVVTDPSVNLDEYNEVQERAQEIIEDTPEGDLPFDEEYVGSYLITCPICGETFTSPQILQSGDTCPICLQQPESFVVKGQLETTETASEIGREQEALDDARIESNKNDEEEDDENPVPNITVSEKEEEEQPEKQTASKEIPEGNKLTEAKLTDYVPEEKIKEAVYNDDLLGMITKKLKILDDMILEITTDVSKKYYKVFKNDDGDFETYWIGNDGKQLSDSFVLIKHNDLEESKNLNEDSYEDGIFYEIEEALRDAGLNPVRFTEDGVMTNNLGWTVTGEDGTQQQITCDGSYLTESKSDEVTAGNIKQKAQELLPAEDIETHDGDLYLKVSDKSTELVNKLKDKENGLLKTFKSEKDNSMWYDIPFANMEDDYKSKNNLDECEIVDDFVELSDINN